MDIIYNQHKMSQIVGKYKPTVAKHIHKLPPTRQLTLIKWNIIVMNIMNIIIAAVIDRRF